MKQSFEPIHHADMHRQSPQAGSAPAAESVPGGEYYEIDVADLQAQEVRNLRLLPFLDRDRRVARISAQEWAHVCLNFGNHDGVVPAVRVVNGAASVVPRRSSAPLPGPPPSYEWTRIMSLPEPVDLTASNLASVIDLFAVGRERGRLLEIRDYVDKRLGILDHTIEFATTSLKSCCRQDIDLELHLAEARSRTALARALSNSSAVSESRLFNDFSRSAHPLGMDVDLLIKNYFLWERMSSSSVFP